MKKDFEWLSCYVKHLATMVNIWLIIISPLLVCWNASVWGLWVLFEDLEVKVRHQPKNSNIKICTMLQSQELCSVTKVHLSNVPAE